MNCLNFIAHSVLSKILTLDIRGGGLKPPGGSENPRPPAGEGRRIEKRIISKYTLPLLDPTPPPPLATSLAPPQGVRACPCYVKEEIV